MEFEESVRLSFLARILNYLFALRAFYRFEDASADTFQSPFIGQDH